MSQVEDMKPITMLIQRTNVRLKGARSPSNEQTCLLDTWNDSKGIHEAWSRIFSLQLTDITCPWTRPRREAAAHGAR